MRPRERRGSLWAAILREPQAQGPELLSDREAQAAVWMSGHLPAGSSLGWKVWTG